MSTNETSQGKKRKACGKREPQRSDYATEDEFKRSWQRWRETRDNNNESVKRSRQLAKQKRQEHEQQYQQRQQENAQLEALVSELKGEVTFLSKVLKDPESLDAEERRRLDQLIEEAGGAAAAAAADGTG
eukprot:m.56375 g.56375  ORF g.56375 m.56375 type:complete len:130 (+) comp12606_c1_seq1:311-700(+)